MAWSNSKIFRAYLADALTVTTDIDLDGDTLKAALYNDTTAPSQDVTAANTAYAVGEWVVGNEVDDGTNWDTGGEPLTGVSVDSATAATVFLDATDTPQGGASTTLASVYGCLVYSETAATPVANQGICYNYFGGVQSVTGGDFTIVWHANGIFRFTL